jgi:L-ascorbate metabolism protein UlaG (beta-lactamase superfamily)
MKITVTYLEHSGFDVAWQGYRFIFDPIGGVIKPGEVTAVLVSHSHSDHFSPLALEIPAQTRFFAGEMKQKEGVSLNPGEHTLMPGYRVDAFDSTDIGVSYRIITPGIKIFHGGDLNLWDWPQESTAEEIAQARDEFDRALTPLEGDEPQVAFFPADPRQGEGFDRGARLFLERVKPRYLFPMHFGGDPRVLTPLARDGKGVIVPRKGKTYILDVEEKDEFCV